MRRARMQWMALVGLLALALGACGGNEAAPTVAPTVAKKKVEPVAPAASAASVDYSYSAIGKRDPFKNLGADLAPTDRAQEEAVTCPDPLCQIDLDDLKVVAVISGDANPVAMLEDRGGVGHIVHRNSKVGKQGGKVTQILRECLVVTSFITGPDGKAAPNKVNMCVDKSDQRNVPVLDLFDGKLRQ